MADRSLEVRFPPRVFVEGTDKTWRAIHRRPAFAGKDIDGLFRVRDIYVLGPVRSDKHLADEDVVSFSAAYAAGLGKLHDVNCKAHAADPGMAGWEFETDMTSDGLKKSRVVCVIAAEADLVRIEGPWQKHRRRAESNLAALQLAFRRAGLDGIRHVATAQAMLTAPVEAFTLPPAFSAKRFKVDRATQTEDSLYW